MISSNRTRFFRCAKLLQQHPDADLIYSDEDKLTEEGFDCPVVQARLVAGFFSLLQLPLPLHDPAARTSSRKLGGFRPEFDGAQDYDLFLRVTRTYQTDSSYPARPLSLAAERDFHGR